MFTKERGAVHGEKGTFLQHTLSQWSGSAAQDISAEEDRMGERVEEYGVSTSSDHGGRPESTLLVCSLSK